MALTAQEIADLITTTQRQLGRMRWTGLATDLQEHVAMRRILRKESVRFDSGTAIQFNVMVGHSNQARNTGLFNVDDVNVVDNMKNAWVPWRHSDTAYAFDRREISMNRRPSKIVDLVKTRRVQSMISLAELMESNFWGKPDDADDTETPYGIDYWFVAAATEGFNGGNPAGFPSGPGNLSALTYPRWRNWTAQYADVSKPDLVRKMRKASRKCRFISPVEHPDYNRGSRYTYETNLDVLMAMEELGEAQNDRLGRDVASMDGQVLFRRTPVEYVPKLDERADDPLYGINWGVFYPVFLRGEYMREDPPREAPNQHNVMEAFTDLTYNFIVRNRRLGFKFTK